MKKPHWLALAGTCFLLDVATKWWVAARLPIHQEIPVIPGFFSITPITNNGIAFSLFAGPDSTWRTVLLTAAAVVSLAYIAWLVWREPRLDGLLGTGLGMVSGGILGNSLNRLLTGSVVDFLDFHYGHLAWPTFNLADTFISVGAGLIVLRLLWPQKDKPCP
jgi:signal peptidase II